VYNVNEAWDMLISSSHYVSQSDPQSLVTESFPSNRARDSRNGYLMPALLEISLNGFLVDGRIVLDEPDGMVHDFVGKRAWSAFL
jgi:hypothetical protein